MNKRILAFDVESTGVNPYGNDSAFAVGWLYYDPSSREVEQIMKPACQNVFDKFQKRHDQADFTVAHNLVFDIAMLEKEGIKFDYASCHDTLHLAALECDQLSSHSLLNLSLKYLDYRGREDVAVDDWLLEKRQKGDPHYDQLPWEIIEPYTTKQLENTAQLFLLWYDDVQERFPKPYAIEQRLPPIIHQMQARGVRVDSALLENARSDILSDMGIEDSNDIPLFETEEDVKAYKETLLDEIRRFDVPPDFNPSSNQQVGEFLVEHGVNLSKTPTGLPQTNEASLERAKHPMADLILRWRRLTKLSSTFIDGLLKYVGEDGCIHTNFRQTGARTGRLSCSSPNLQQLSKGKGKKGEIPEAEVIRKAFVSRPGFTTYSFDFSGMELRTAIGLAGDEKAIKALNEGADFHNMTLQFLRNYVPRGTRTLAKNANFLQIFGGGAKKLKTILNAPMDVVHNFMDEYESQFPDVFNAAKRYINFADAKGYIDGLYDRRFRLRKDEGAYKVCNYIIQGSCAYIMKKVMGDVAEIPHCNLLLQVHDEIICEVEMGYEGEVVPQIKHTMEAEPKRVLGLEIPVDIALWCPGWGSQKEIEI